MNKHLLILSLSALLFSLDSCVKDDNEPEVSPQYVELGLSVKWATFNVGASCPEDFGNYYAWAEISTKNRYYWSTYKYNVGTEADSLTKYNTVDSLTVLDIKDDVAKAKWGENWRIPSDVEFQELLDSCTWEWKDINGIKGYQVTSNVLGYTDKSIFLPAACYYGGSNVLKDTPTGAYWTNCIDPEFPDAAYCVIFDSDNQYISSSGRYIGRSIRPVCP